MAFTLLAISFDRPGFSERSAEVEADGPSGVRSSAPGEEAGSEWRPVCEGGPCPLGIHGDNIPRA
jgi:hypothetical protein